MIINCRKENQNKQSFYIDLVVRTLRIFVQYEFIVINLNSRPYHVENHGNISGNVNFNTNFILIEKYDSLFWL
jgi:hypothetical protein